jgi:hypothetical protein
MPTVSVVTDFPPRTLKVVTGAGTLTRVTAATPPMGNNLSMDSNGVRFDSSLQRISGVMNADFYDGLSLASATPLISLSGTTDSGPLNLIFTTGLLMVSRNPSAINVTTA